MFFSSAYTTGTARQAYLPYYCLTHHDVQHLRVAKENCWAKYCTDWPGVGLLAVPHTAVCRFSGQWSILFFVRCLL